MMMSFWHGCIMGVHPETRLVVKAAKVYCPFTRRLFDWAEYFHKRAGAEPRDAQPRGSQASYSLLRPCRLHPLCEAVQQAILSGHRVHMLLLSTYVGVEKMRYVAVQPRARTTSEISTAHIPIPMAESVIMSAYVDLPPELHSFIFAYLRSPGDRSALAASCRFLRQWRGLAWQRIEIEAKRIDGLLLQSQRLVRAMHCDDELPLFVQEVYVRELGVHLNFSRLWPNFLDGNIAQILRLATNLHTFVFDAPITDVNESYSHILCAIASSPSLRSISLNNVGSSEGDAIVSLPSMTSIALERLIIGMNSAVDITRATKNQLQLKYLHFELCWKPTWDSVSTLQMMSSWVLLEELVLCTDHESSFKWDAWLDMLEIALVCILGDLIPLSC